MDSRSFLRIHRSTIVNIQHVRSVRRDEFGRLCVTIKDHGDVLAVSKPFERVFRPF
jgi:DNA-binding LytR/AlgR family response regulator